MRVWGWQCQPKNAINATVKAEQINNPNWYDARPCKIKNKAGSYDNGFEIQRMNFKTLVATK